MWTFILVFQSKNLQTIGGVLKIVLLVGQTWVGSVIVTSWLCCCGQVI